MDNNTPKNVKQDSSFDFNAAIHLTKSMINFLMNMKKMNCKYITIVNITKVNHYEGKPMFERMMDTMHAV